MEGIGKFADHFLRIAGRIDGDEDRLDLPGQFGRLPFE
jgi:hypothetical protein